ncbi:MAG TPA: TolC family protein [Rhodocyclaceae bacterium]|jgi:cobalt-zinc-cadmium efflux system outer membrane protein|nr:TolC family protein [Rhodocyclaceae bacterium]
MNPKCARHSLPFIFLILAASALADTPAYTREQLESLARASSPAILAARNQIETAAAAVRTAGAWPNPEIEYQKGDGRARQITGVPGKVETYTITQPIDMPWVRNARIGAAEAGLASAQALGRGLVSDVIARIRLRYFDVLRRQAEVKAAEEDLTQMESVRDRIALRVEVGEAPRFELVKADAEMLNAQKNAYTANLRVNQSRTALRALIGPALPADYMLQGQLQDVLTIKDLDGLRNEIRDSNPDVLRARAEQERATRLLAQEKAKRLPTFALRGSKENDPDLSTSRIGVVMTIPLWDRRSGPVDEARANLARADNELAGAEFSLDSNIAIAYEQYQITLAQVNALESGIVRQAENALRIAENAYRFGERGILDVLDAQRVYRAARSELINARYEAASTWTELERLRANTN